MPAPWDPRRPPEPARISRIKPSRDLALYATIESQGKDADHIERRKAGCRYLKWNIVSSLLALTKLLVYFFNNGFDINAENR